MSNALSGREVGMALCKMLGIDPSNVLGIEVRAFPDEIARVTLTTLARPVGGLQTEITQQFDIIERK